MTTASAIPAVHIGLREYLTNVQAVVKQHLSAREWVVAELSEFNLRPNGMCNLVLVDGSDGGGPVKCQASMYANVAKGQLEAFKLVTGSMPAAGMKVMLKLAASFHPQYGFQLQVFGLDPAYTLGEMHARIELIIAKLREEGVYDQQRTLKAPTGFWRVAVVSPDLAAGLGDFRREADILQRHQLVHFDYFSALFQGGKSSESIRNALRQVFEAHKQMPYDAVCLIRGGGAKADLAWLNDMALARWVCRIPIPVFTGIGHERDESILDLVAHTRFDTPSKVIGAIVRFLHVDAQQLQTAIDKVGSGIERKLTLTDGELTLLNSRYSRSLLDLLANAELNLHKLDSCSQSAVSQMIHSLSMGLEKSASYWERSLSGVVTLAGERLLADWEQACVLSRQIIMKGVDEYKDSFYAYKRLVPSFVELQISSMTDMSSRYRHSVYTLERDATSNLQESWGRGNTLMLMQTDAAATGITSCLLAFRRVVPRLLADSEKDLVRMQQHAGRAISRDIEAQEKHLVSETRMVVSRALRVIETNESKLSALFQRYEAAALSLLDLGESQLINRQDLFNAINPRNLMAKGFGLVRDAAGAVVKSAGEVDVGGLITIQFADGTVEAVASEVRG